MSSYKINKIVKNSLVFRPCKTFIHIIPVSLGDFRTGQPMVGKPCSWEFNSTLERFGTIHSPDYKVLDKIECEYHFFGAADEYVEFEISITSLE